MAKKGGKNSGQRGFDPPHTLFINLPDQRIIASETADFGSEKSSGHLTLLGGAAMMYGNKKAISKGAAMPFARGIGIPELVIILVIVMIIFGVGRLPQVGGALGHAIKEFRSSQFEKDDSSSDSEGEESGTAGQAKADRASEEDDRVSRH